MPRYVLYMWMLKVTWLLFILAFGACLGSLTNVIAYRLPRGISIVSPPSRCPSCGTKLTWRENIPVFGWLLLRGKCRFCKAAISPEYPIVEASVALLFGLLYAACYMIPASGGLWLGIDWSAFRPEWTLNSGSASWPVFLVVLTIFGSLAAMTLVDAKTFTIPLILTWVPAVVGVVVHTGWAAWTGPLRFVAEGWTWAIPTPAVTSWSWILAPLLGMCGILMSLTLLRVGLIRRSFADYDEWEQEHLAARKGALGDEGEPPDPETGDHEPDDPATWIRYPHARREMVKELAFLCLPALGVLLGWWLGGRVAWSPAPFWLSVLAGSLLGYLVGGGVVWGVRIFGSLAFGKEAMGLGDVHLMAAVGACLGWIDATVAFFLAAFVGLILTAATAALSKASRTLPYGPSLAIATLLVFLGKPLVERGITAMVAAPSLIDLP